jgi:hypothetical protein
MPGKDAVAIRVKSLSQNSILVTKGNCKCPRMRTEEIWSNDLHSERRTLYFTANWTHLIDRISTFPRAVFCWVRHQRLVHKPIKNKWQSVNKLRSCRVAAVQGRADSASASEELRKGIYMYALSTKVSLLHIPPWKGIDETCARQHCADWSLSTRF